MKISNLTLISIISACLLSSCFGIDEGNLRKLAPIAFNDVPSQIDVSLGEVLIYDKLEVISEKPVTYQWAYGKKAANAKHEYDMESMEIISSEPQINYTFSKLGSYILRLRVDNGESIEYKYFTLNVNSGLDEGLLILSSDEGGRSVLGFIKTRSEDEKDRGAKEVWEDVFRTINPDTELSHGSSLFLSSFTSGGISYNHLLLSTADEHGNIYDIEPKTMNLVMATPMKDQYGTWCCDFSGRQTAATGAYTFIRAADGRVFRHDLFTPFLTERTDVASTAGTVGYSKNILYGTSATDNIKSVFYTETMLCQPDNNGSTILRTMPTGWKIVNFFSDRDANRTYILLRSDADPRSYAIKYTTASLGALQDVSEFTAESVNMDINSVFCSSCHSNDVYYTYDNAIYRWSMTGKPAESPTFRLPAGEQICDIATNYMGSSSITGAETLLYVATWNPSRSGDMKGSIYVYDIATDTLQNVYEGVCYKTARILYKYRIS